MLFSLMCWFAVVVVTMAGVLVIENLMERNGSPKRFVKPLLCFLVWIAVLSPHFVEYPIGDDNQTRYTWDGKDFKKTWGGFHSPFGMKNFVTLPRERCTRPASVKFYKNDVATMQSVRVAKITLDYNHYVLLSTFGLDAGEAVNEAALFVPVKTTDFLNDNLGGLPFIVKTDQGRRDMAKGLENVLNHYLNRMGIRAHVNPDDISSTVEEEYEYNYVMLL